ncbi:hypothetical protein P7K49_020097, partial [Saguinus oedipus]
LERESRETTAAATARAPSRPARARLSFLGGYAGAVSAAGRSAAGRSAAAAA